MINVVNAFNNLDYGGQLTFCRSLHFHLPCFFLALYLSLNFFVIIRQFFDALFNADPKTKKIFDEFGSGNETKLLDVVRKILDFIHRFADEDPSLDQHHFMERRAL